MIVDLKSYLDLLVSRDTPSSPRPDPEATGQKGYTVVRCPKCGYALILRIEQFCPCCGQRFFRDTGLKDWAEEYRKMTARTLKDIYGGK